MFLDIWMKRGNGGESIYGPVFEGLFYWLSVTVGPTDTLTHIHNRLMAFFSRTAWVGRYHKDKPFWILLKQEMMGWQWHQLNHMQIICTSLQTDNNASTSSLHIFYRPMPFLPPNQQRQSTEGPQLGLQRPVIFIRSSYYMYIVQLAVQLTYYVVCLLSVSCHIGE